MKPFFLFAYNKIRIFLIGLTGRNLEAQGIQLFSRKTVFTISKGGNVKIGDRFVTDGVVVLNVDKGAYIEIGNRVYCNRGTMISSKSSIRIGSGCRLGPNVIIIDNNHKYDAIHGVTGEHTTESISIGNNCWIGANTVILKGSIIGDNSVIGAGCIISGSIPPTSVVTQRKDLIIKKMRQ